MPSLKGALFGALAVLPYYAEASGLGIGSGGRTIQAAKSEAQAEALSMAKRDTNPRDLYPAYNISVPVDHFHNESQYEPHSCETFDLRYWFDASHYKSGGPVIILQSGETSGVGRLVFLQKGILSILAKATNGIGVVLEHRYYGTSFPTPNITTENLRFLTTEQALADEAYFSQNIVFPGLENLDLTSENTAHIAYGGSYAGAFVSFLRVLYPETFWGSISSSGVTKAIYDYWAYYEPVATYAPKECTETQKTFTHVVDNILIGKKDDTELISTLKSAFGLGDLTYNSDFANQLAGGVGNWQSLNWDPEVSSDEFYRFCGNLTSKEILYPDTADLERTAARLIGEGGYDPKPALVNQMLNYIGYVNLTTVSRCPYSTSQDECFSNYNATSYSGTEISDYTWRSWAYQYCSEWGYLQTGSGVPQNQLPLISRTIDLEYTSLVCKYAFNITSPADTQRVNKYGGYDIAYPRLAFLDGEWDPWKPATPHAYKYGAKKRKSTISEPFILIDDAVHHWDENGRFKNETTEELPPAAVREAQMQEVKFVRAWMREWKYKCAEEGRWWW